MADSGHLLKIAKWPSQQQFDQLAPTKFGKITHYPPNRTGSKISNLEKSKMADGRHLEKSKKNGQISATAQNLT